MTYSDPAAYERFMGRWSARLAPLFVRFAGIEDGKRVLDVGCGTGTLSRTLPPEVSRPGARAASDDAPLPLTRLCG